MRWEIKYNSSDIKVETRFTGERLFVNGELQDEQIGAFSIRSRLWGQLPTGECIKVSIGGGVFTERCSIFINHKLIFSK